MVKKSRKLLNRFLVCLLAMALITPTGVIAPKKAYADTVAPAETPVLSSTSYRYLLVGESYDFNILNKISGSTYKWESSNTKIAVVNKSGLVTAKKQGTAKITCKITSGGKTQQLAAEVYVKKSVSFPAEKISIINKIQTLLVGEKYNLNKSFEPKYSKDFVNWTSNNTNIATVNKSGIVTGIKPGLVKITATALSGVSDSVYIEISTATTVGDQSSLEKALKSPVVKSIKIVTDKEMEFNIPKGNYSDKSLFVKAPKGSVNNHGLFKEINIQAIKSDTWHEYAQGNNIIIDTATSRIVIEESAAAFVHVTRSGSDINFVILGDADIFVEASGNIVITGASGVAPNVSLLGENITIKTDLALNVDASQKATLILNTDEASKTRVNAESEDSLPEVQGKGSITVVVGGVSKVIHVPAVPPVVPPSSGTPGGETPPLIPSRVLATFGSPIVDGEIDAIWNTAAKYIPKVYGAASDVSASHRIMWDDNALYILSEIKDSILDKSNSATYQQDSLEIFLDELYDKGTSYNFDDLHYRVNFDNFRSYDAGEKTRFYSKTKRTADGYIVEACIVWDQVTPANGTEYGFDLQINEAKNGSRATTITIFDTTGNAYQNPSLFGKLVLEGKKAEDSSGTNPYILLAYIDSVKEIYLDAYVNKEIIDEPLESAEQVANSKTSTQEQINNAYVELKAAVDALDDGSGFIKPSALPEIAELPDVFTFLNGSKVTNLAQWDQRKEEISEMYQYYMYGMARSGEAITYEDVASYTAWVFNWSTWQMEQRTVTPAPNQKFTRINIEKDGRTANFMATMTFPSTTVDNVTTITPPVHPDGYPVLIVIGSLGANEKNYLNQNGYAVIEFDTGSVASDNYNRTGAFYSIYPYGSTYDQQTGVLMAWAWGVSKIIDVLEIDAAGANTLQISPVNTIVTGVSRNGKAAAVAGAFDSRIRVTAPGSSGAGGMAMFRYNSAGHVHDYSSLDRQEFIEFDGNDNSWNNFQANPLHTVGTNESLSNIQSGSEGHWFNDTFQGFSNPGQLPFDQYYLAALASGEDRYFYITAEVNGSDWINSQGMYASYLAAQNVYDSLNISDNIGIHLHSTGHAFTLEDTRYLVELCNKTFYGIVDDVKDLNDLKTSLYELPTNYDPYFDTLKAMDGPVLVKSPGKVTAVYGSPFVDGEIDDSWSKAFVYVPKLYDKPAEVTAKHRIMWDENALYVLSEVKDSNLDKASANAYEQDSLELFLDELYDKGTAYKSDDVHYRVNFDNFRTYDAGDKPRFYSKTKLTEDGYIVEACIIWDQAAPQNNLELGFDLQINEASGGKRTSVITIFDTTGNAYQNPSLFGKLVLKGKGPDDAAGKNPYALLAYIDSVKEIYLDAYINKDIINAPLAEAELIASSPDSTQEEIDAAFLALKLAVDSLDDGSGFIKASALPKVTELPDVFTFLNGSPVTSLEEWELRKEEILEMYQYYMYGVAPDPAGEDLSVELLDSYMLRFEWNGQVYEFPVTAQPNQKFIKMNITKGDASANFIATATFPSTTIDNVTTITPPVHPDGYPVLIVIGSLGANEKNYLNQNGYAVIEFDTGSVASDNYNRTGAFYNLYPYGRTWETQTGVLMAWAWGVSKIIDALEIEALGANTLQISPVNTIVTGVSRNGKAAAVAGAFDSRIRVTAPGSSGAGGMAMFRYNSAGHVHDYSSLDRQEFIEFDGNDNSWNNFQANPMHTVGTNESLSNIQSGSEGHWFNDTFQGFSSPEQLPFDQYYLAALASGPDRYFYITAEVNGSDWINSQGMYASYLAAQKVYDSLGIGDNIGIHLHSTGHAFTLEDTRYLVELCNKTFYGVVDGVKDLNDLKTSLYELPANYDPYFDVLKNLPFPDLAGAALYYETFDSGVPAILTTVSGSAITYTLPGGNNVLQISQSDGEAYVILPIVNSVSGSVITVSGSAITITGSAVTESGLNVTISVELMYDTAAESPVVFETGIINGGIFTPIITTVESEVNNRKGQWIKHSIPMLLPGNLYLYIKVYNVTSYYIDNIKIKM